METQPTKRKPAELIASERLEVRVTGQLRDTLEMLAEAEGNGLSAWLRRVITRQAQLELSAIPPALQAKLRAKIQRRRKLAK